jgi:hypothetical protein
MSENHSTRGLRFGVLIRVSSERQEKKGESLSTQRASNARDVDRLGGTVAGWYGGQEHATPSWEKREVDRLIRDARRGLFDAVMVAYADRWSRDNKKSKEGLEVFREHGVRFLYSTNGEILWFHDIRHELSPSDPKTSSPRPNATPAASPLARSIFTASACPSFTPPTAKSSGFTIFAMS